MDACNLFFEIVMRRFECLGTLKRTTFSTTTIILMEEKCSTLYTMRERVKEDNRLSSPFCTCRTQKDVFEQQLLRGMPK